MKQRRPLHSFTFNIR